MFIALDSNRNRVSVENAVEGARYFCPICGEPLFIRESDSSKEKTHFVHGKDVVCRDDWDYDASEWHWSWQNRFPEQHREIVLERKGVRHRAGIIINGTVIEFRHSRISKEEIEKRNKFYISCGYKVVWVFDATGKIKNWLEKTIDPMKCNSTDLCWKRTKPQFEITITPQVSVFLQYKTCIANEQHANQEFDIMLLLTQISSKELAFYKTMPYYILPTNFLKQFGISQGDDVLSVAEIIQHTKVFVQQERMRQYASNPDKAVQNALEKARSKRQPK